MASSVLRRRFATAAGLYLSVTLGILGTIAAARIFGLEDFGRFATVLAVVGLAQTLLDLTVEESLTKFGFRYIATEDWGRLRRLFTIAIRFKALGALFALAALAAFAPAANWVFGAHGLTAPTLAVAFLPLVQTQEDVAATALLLRGRYDLRAGFLAFS